jgi:hypothetical protein
LSAAKIREINTLPYYRAVCKKQPPIGRLNAKHNYIASTICCIRYRQFRNDNRGDTPNLERGKNSTLKHLVLHKKCPAHLNSCKTCRLLSERHGMNFVLILSMVCVALQPTADRLELHSAFASIATITSTFNLGFLLIVPLRTTKK